MLSSIPLPKVIVRPPETVLVNITPQETRVAMLEENNICELHIERNSGHGWVGNIYLGVVRRVLPVRRAQQGGPGLPAAPLGRACRPGHGRSV